ncbi:MAG: F0F1 ATP synthase subunit epsilon [Actinobacteria bacterium]|nr:F0F1 ATP synthase subunit epsilon [Actinomycetota bacterium]
MPGLSLRVVTPEREVLHAEEVDIVLAPGVGGQLGILPRHAPLITGLAPGTLMARQGGELTTISIAGGFLQVMDNDVTVLADASERAHEIDLARAQRARDRAVQEMRDARIAGDFELAAQARAAMLRATARIRTAGRRESR